MGCRCSFCRWCQYSWSLFFAVIVAAPAAADAGKDDIEDVTKKKCHIYFISGYDRQTRANRSDALMSRETVSLTTRNKCPFCYHRHPCVATVAVYVLLLFIFLFFPFVLRNYSTDSHPIFRDCVFWCSLNNPVVLKFFWLHLEQKNAKNAKIC